MISKAKTMMRHGMHKSVLFKKAYQILSRCKVALSMPLSDKTYIRWKYYTSTGRKLELKNPKRFNEKLQWLKLYNRDPLYTQLVDKFEVRSFVEQKIGREYLTNCYGVYDTFDDIPFKELPNSFVMKCTHDCGSIVICKDKAKLDFAAARKKLSNALKHNYFYQGREWPYKNVRPRIIVEEYLEDLDKGDLLDYKFFCFGGKSKLLFIVSGRQSTDMRLDFYDMEFQHMPFERGYPNSENGHEKPRQFELMIELAEKLSENIPFVRVDFYDIKDRVVFGEMTFFPGGGMEEFTPDEWDYKLGEWLPLKKD